ncbi:MAG: ATP phosphoribosyltransferase regulatory subunit, partial [Solobacterium sp.]|nr:ATP phosphoribosyltransferase regulatory subunit [Solobacterium sp.]
MKQIQIPGGMRDLLAGECAAKEELRKRISAVYTAYGYQPVETPLIEFYSTYQNTFTSLKEETLYKFVDESGQILTLRTDMTLPIARVCVTRFGQD